jgi:hypothetical protein
MLLHSDLHSYLLQVMFPFLYLYFLLFLPHHHCPLQHLVPLIFHYHTPLHHPLVPLLSYRILPLLPAFILSLFYHQVSPFPLTLLHQTLRTSCPLILPVIPLFYLMILLLSPLTQPLVQPILLLLTLWSLGLRLVIFSLNNSQAFNHFTPSIPWLPISLLPQKLNLPTTARHLLILGGRLL